MPTAAAATIASGSQNQDAASTAPTAALANAPQKASTTRRLRSAWSAQGICNGAGMPRMAARNPYRPLFLGSGSARLATTEGGTGDERTAGGGDGTVLPGGTGRDARWLGPAGGDRAPDRQPRAAGRHGASGRAHRRRPERPGDRTGRRVLRLQQWRLRLAAGGEPVPPRHGGIRLRQRPDRARRSANRCGPCAVRPLRRQQAERAERHRVRHAWRVLFHRPGQDPRARPRSRRDLLRAGGRLEDRRGRASRS